MSENSPEKDVIKLMYEYPLDLFLSLKQLVEVRDAMQIARMKDDELTKNN